MHCQSLDLFPIERNASFCYRWYVHTSRPAILIKLLPLERAFLMLIFIVYTWTNEWGSSVRTKTC